MDGETKQAEEKRWEILRGAFVFDLAVSVALQKNFTEHLGDYGALASDKYLNFDAIFKPST